MRRLFYAALGTLFLMLAWRDPIERHVLHTPLAAPVMIVVYGAAVIGPWVILKWLQRRQDAV